jgi:hypothetical protein
MTPDTPVQLMLEALDADGYLVFYEQNGAITIWARQQALPDMQMEEDGQS